MKQLNTSLVVAALGLIASGCATSIPETQPGEYPPVMPISTADYERTNGSIYSTQVGFSLFGDRRAHLVGDMLTVRLIEETQASKTASTDTSRTTSIDTGSPVILGRTITDNGLDLLTTTVDTDQSFEGSASSSQSNQLIGDITVTVAEVLANGNLIVRGEKWLTLNQGQEYIRISGIVRPTDIGSDNSIESWRMADARIAYSGKGHLANTNKPGWLSRFFSNVLSPF